MEFFKKETNIDFLKLQNKAIGFSISLFLLSIVAVFQFGLSLGLDFTGGSQIELVQANHDNNGIDIEDIRTKLTLAGFEKFQVQRYGDHDTALVQTAPLDNQGITSSNLRATVESALPAYELTRVETVGPQVGKTLLTHGILAIIISLMGTMIYIALRFEYRFAISAAVSMIHDPILIVGIFSAWQIEFNLISLAAVLTVLGYSLNDTIVVYDRIRENFRKYKDDSAETIVNRSINQTLSRTTITSSVTLLVVIALLIYGGETLHGFAIALIIGIVIGTYSSIYVAGTLAIKLGLSREDFYCLAAKTASKW